MNFIALKVYVNNNWEYLDLNSDLSFKKSNGLYLFSEVEYSRSTNINIPTTENNLRILNDPNIPTLDGYYMTIKLDARLTIESGEIYGQLLVNKSQKHQLTSVFIFDSCDLLDYINDKEVEQIGLSDDIYSINWNSNNITPANDTSLDTKKIAIIPYLTDGIVGSFNNLHNAKVLYKEGCLYPSVKLSSLLYDCLYKAKQDISSDIDISHLFDENTDFEKNNYWIITDSLIKKDSISVNFTKTDNITITEGLGVYSGGLEIVEYKIKCITGINFWGENQGFNCSCFKLTGINGYIDITFGNIPPDKELIIARPEGMWGFTNLKTGRLMVSMNDLVPVHSGEVITIPANGYFSFFEKSQGFVGTFFYTGGRIYFNKEYNDGDWSMSASLYYPQIINIDNEDVEENLVPYDTWKLSSNPIQVNVMDLIKTFAYLTGTQFIYDADRDRKRGRLLFVKSKVLSTKEIKDITEITSLEKRVGSYSRKETIDFDTSDYVEKLGSTRVIRSYEVVNECLEDNESEHTSPFDEGALPTLENFRYFRPDGTNYVFDRISRLYRKDIEITYDVEDGNTTYEIEYNAPGLTIALSSTNFSGVNNQKYELLRRVDQRNGSGGFVEDKFYTDIFNNATKYEIKTPMSIQEFMEFSIYSDILLNGTRYAWLNMDWSKGICKIVLQKCTNYWMDYYNIETRANPSLAGSTSGDGTYLDGDIATISTIPAPGCTLINWTDENNTVVSNNLTFDHTVHSSKVFTANYDVSKYYIDLTSAPDGSYGSLSGEGYYWALDTCYLDATPNPGYYFVGWFENNILLSTQPDYSFTVNSNRSLVGQFEKAPKYHITLGVEGVASGIEVGLSGQGYYNGGTTCSVSVSINELQRSGSYTFLGWYENNQLVSTTNPYSFIVDRDRHLVAKFQKNVLVSITTKDTDAGTWTGDGYYMIGDDVILQAFPSDGYEFSYWRDSNTDPATLYYDNPLTLTNIQDDIELEVIFSSTNNISIIIIDNEGGSTTGSGYYSSGDTVIIEATPNNGYTFSYWEDEQGNHITSNPYSFTALTNRIFKPRYDKIKYIVSTNVNPRGAGSVYGNGNSFYYGDVCQLTATPYTRSYVFSNWSENGNILSTDNPYRFEVFENRTITANFIQDSNTYTITISTQYDPDNGTVQFDTPDTYTITISEEGNGTVQFDTTTNTITISDDGNGTVNFNN